MPMDAPISVVIPCYCCSQTILRAVLSVLDQTYLPKEVILVNDCSPDQGLTLQELRNISEKYVIIPFIIVSLDVNMGPGIARNMGWDQASQPYVAFLDADDTWHPRKLEIQYKWLHAHPAIVLSGHYSLEADQRSQVNKEHPSNGDIEADEILFWDMFVSNRFATRTVMVRSDLPFRFKEKKYSEDSLLWLEIIIAGYKAVVLKANLALSYRPEFSQGGYSGSLWAHEKRELNSWLFLYRNGKIALTTYFFAISWCLTKYLRRVLVRFGRSLII
jgi:glycosyltransferase involved in cell wall biosynthesis